MAQVETQAVQDIELVPLDTKPGQIVAMPPQVPALATPLDLAHIALARGDVDLDRLERLMTMQREWKADAAREAFNAAFAAFKSEAVRIIKNRTVTDGPLKGKSFAELHSVVGATTEPLARHGLSTSWSVVEDAKDWIRVRCTLKHSAGHSEYVELGGPPDAGGAKNAIQARASTITYLERYTLKAILGIAEQEDDSDGSGDAAPPAAQAYDAADFASKLEQWQAALKSKSTTADKLIAFIEARSGRRLSEEQAKTLRSTQVE